MKTYTVSVRDMVETVLICGDIDSRYTKKGSMQEGSEIHRMLQKYYSENDRAEVTVRATIEKEFYSLIVQGRIDGVLSYAEDPIIEEIKSTVAHTDSIQAANTLHLAQAKVYGYLYAKEQVLDSIRVRVTYYGIENKQTKLFEERFSFDELRQYFEALCEKYFIFLDLREQIVTQRDRSIASTVFPYPFRKYQKRVIGRIHQAICEEKNIFINAPTGTGKTLNALFPALKTLPERNNGKIFYLSSKSTQKQISEDTLRLMVGQGLQIKSVTITAKEKACFRERPSCNPEDCVYAEGYYDKLTEAIRDILQNENVITADYLKNYGLAHHMCPFELSLDLSNWSDVIICDYNYVFDPFAALKRYFDESATKADHLFLVDEAHNLIDRSRDMYSAILDKQTVLDAKRAVKAEKKLSRYLREINTALLNYKKECGASDIYMMEELDDGLHTSLYRFLSAADQFLSEHTNKKSDDYLKIFDLYFVVTHFLSLYDMRASSHSMFYDAKEDHLKLFCADAQQYLRSCLAKGKSGIFFSATLTPLSYHCELLGGNREDYLLDVPGIFKESNFTVVTDSAIRTSYSQRSSYFPVIADHIHTVLTARSCNKLVFVPSYEFMQHVLSHFCERYPEEIFVQKRHMSEEERADFLSEFDRQTEMTAFAVAGGVFSEGIDLTGERLGGVIVCGVSLPKVCTERELIRIHFENKERNGFDYAYLIPGMNKVLQSMGRVIRTESDVGYAVLMDERFAFASYRNCLPPHYSEIKTVCTQEELFSALQ